MDRHLRLAFIFKDTMQQLSANKKLRKATEEAKSKAKFYDATSELDTKHQKDSPNIIEVTSERTFEAANDDKLLISLIWKIEGWNYSKNILWNLCRVSSPETIRRTRQKLVEEGLIKPSKKVTEARYQDFKQARMSIRFH